MLRRKNGPKTFKKDNPTSKHFWSHSSSLCDLLNKSSFTRNVFWDFSLMVLVIIIIGSYVRIFTVLLAFRLVIGEISDTDPFTEHKSAEQMNTSEA